MGEAKEAFTEVCRVGRLLWPHTSLLGGLEGPQPSAGDTCGERGSILVCAPEEGSLGLLRVLCSSPSAPKGSVEVTGLLSSQSFGYPVQWTSAHSQPRQTRAWLLSGRNGESGLH